MRTAVLIPLALATLLLAACGSSGGDSTGDKTTTTAPAKAIMCPEGGDFNTAELIGKTEQAAESLAKENGCTIRVTERDGKQFPMTMDYRRERVNVVVTGGKVSEVTGVG